MGDTKKVHPSETMTKDGGTEISLKEKEDKLESDFGQDEKKKEYEENKPAEMVAYGDLVNKILYSSVEMCIKAVWKVIITIWLSRVFN